MSKSSRQQHCRAHTLKSTYDPLASSHAVYGGRSYAVLSARHVTYGEGHGQVPPLHRDRNLHRAAQESGSSSAYEEPASSYETVKYEVLAGVVIDDAVA